MPAFGFDPANICQIPFVRPLNYNCKLTARLMVGPKTTITESSRHRLRLSHIAKDPLEEENSKETSSLSLSPSPSRLVSSLFVFILPVYAYLFVTQNKYFSMPNIFSRHHDKFEFIVVVSLAKM